MFRPLLSLAVIGTVLLSSGFARAEGVEKYTFDKPHTQVIFSVNHLGFTNSYGRFLDYDGGFTLDRTDPSKSTVDATIKTASLDMGDGKWDEHLKSPDFFNVAQFPTMHFVSTKVTKTGEKTADILGDMTILGVTKPVTLKVTYNNSGVFPMNDKMYVAGFTATAKLTRSEFGMTKYVPMVGDDVNITLEVQGNQVDYKGPAKGKE
ncbi:MAG: yceI-like domain protein [Micavibrio sp.]|nr:yceI-like domain protein [Micavibrio sp.]